jgi:hypothetical protein
MALALHFEYIVVCDGLRATPVPDFSQDAVEKSVVRLFSQASLLGLSRLVLALVLQASAPVTRKSRDHSGAERDQDLRGI